MQTFHPILLIRRKLALFVITGHCLKYHYPIRDDTVVMDSNHDIIHFCILFLYVTFSLIGSASIDTDTCAQVLLQIFFGAYPNHKFQFSFPIGLNKFVSRVIVRRTYLT